MKIEQILEEVQGLREHLIKKEVGKRHNLTAIDYDEESGTVGYALHIPTSTLTFTNGCATMGVYREGKYAEKHFDCMPVTEVKVSGLNPKRIDFRGTTKMGDSYITFEHTELE